MSLVSELPHVVEDVALARGNADGVVLTEEESGMRVQIVARSPMTAIRLGKGGVSHVPGLNLHAGLNVIGDYLVVVESKGRTHAVLVELKATWEPRAREQVRRSLPLLEYLRSVCEVQRQAPFDDKGMQIGYLVICENRRLNKQTMKAAPVKTLDCEDYKNVRIWTYIGTTISLAILTRVSSD